MSKFAIVVAMERELRPLVGGWRVNEKEANGRRYRFFESGDAVAVCGGIGSDAARRAAEGVISLYAPRMIYSAGFAGALDSKLKAGDIVRPAWVVNASDASRVAIAGGDGVLVSFASVASPEQKAKLRESFAASAVDMEAAAVARAAEARGVAFAAVKAISDESDFEFPSMERFVDSEGRFHDGRFAAFAAMRPWLWGRVMRLATNSARASRALCTAIEKIVADAAGSPVLEAASKR